MTSPEIIITVLPGDDVTKHIIKNTKSSSSFQHIKLGVGLKQKKNSSSDESSIIIIATCAGRLHQQRRRNNTWFVLTSDKLYTIPRMDDRVIGVIMDRASSSNGGNVYRCFINSTHPATIHNVEAFEGATKRNKPHFSAGTILYARIQHTDSYSDPTLSCILGSRDVGIPRKDWMTNEGTYGELKGGTLQKISLGLARELLHPNNVVLEELSKQLAFEVCIGVNGMLWVHSERPEITILVLNAICNSEVLTEEQTRAMVQRLVKTVQRQMAADDDNE